ncbi:virulence factor Mce-like protein [Williamsia limnetica]|uniref:Virulence factor Mce-like protein n=1 Tax=Williamsia limnetica TaxID=882452 RepID=A0A318RGT8_WILLI|nr:MlaD family protein [Williamsia limnetica]PYE16288.1 virulence factor Mce-like protein [Williamsia limnetica]
MTRRTAAAAVGAMLALAMTTTACSVELESVPLPKRNVGSDSYTVYATFENALNLPKQAKVKLAGADVGSVEGMTVRDYSAIVTLRISENVTLPVGTRAELRSATPLGDIFVAMQPPLDAAPDGPVLVGGDGIELDQTSAAATIEEVLTTSSLLVNGGVIRNITKVINGLGEAVGDKGGELAGLIEQSTSLVSKLSARTGEIRSTLNETNRLVSTLTAGQGTIKDAIAAAGPAMSVLSANTDQILGIVNQLASVSSQLAKFPSIAGTAAGGLIADINTIAAELNAAALNPNADLDAVNRLLAPVIKITNSSGSHVDADLEDFAIGAIADPTHTADPGSRIPDLGTDGANFVGTLTSTLQRLGAKVAGPRR